jgi:hypothetical protein
MLEGFYTTKDLMEQTILSKSAIQFRVEKLRLPYRVHKVNGSLKIRYYTESEANRIINYKSRQFDPEIIYVHTIWEIRESKLNYTKLKKL